MEPLKRGGQKTVEPLERSDEAGRLQEAAANLLGAQAELAVQNTEEPLEHSDEARRLQEAAWPDMLANLQGAYAELVNTRFELERSSEQVAETRDLYQQIVASTSEAFFLTDLTGRVILTNPAAARLLECEEQTILNRELAAVCGVSEVPATPWELAQRDRGGRLENLEVEVTTVKGARVPVSFNCTLMRDKQRKTTGVLAVAHDMRRIRALIENLIAARTRFEELFELAPEALALSDGEGRITLVNSQTEKLFGYTRQELIGRNIETLFPEPFRNMLTSRTLEERTELSGLRSDLAEFPVEIIQRRVGAEDEPLTMSLINDITERKRAERERELLAREQEARRVAEEDNQMKDDFLATISHELRTPLTAILGWTKILRSGDVDRASAERALVTIERNAQAQARLIGDLLDASRIITGKLRLEEIAVDLRSVVEAAVDTVRPAVEAKRLRLQLVIEPWVGSCVGDPERLKQALLNLLNNAVKFTPEKGLIEVRLEKLEHKALLIVSDTGQGIDQDFLPYVFDRFRQADSSIKRSKGGLGLGLAIVKYIIEAHNGAIYAYSRGPGEGSDFMITIPLAEASQGGLTDFLWSVGGLEASETPDEAQVARRHDKPLQGVRALFVDDERDTREVLCAILNSFGADARAASSAAEGFEVLRQWRPDVVVSDIGMPVEDGYEFINRVRALSAEEGGETPAIALTAFAGSDDRERALSSGFQLHMGKPIEPAALAGVVARLLGRGDHRTR
ncbi:MAG: PAS domain S-box protein [Chloracidobacterium sp.]|nr:PAS domain S-box protein [Chloracidobacterium sp.]